MVAGRRFLGQKVLDAIEWDGTVPPQALGQALKKMENPVAT
jgi:hypothetical protein